MPVDYDEISRSYDVHRQGGGPYLPKLVELARAASANRVLEIGPGTGNNTRAFQESYPCDLIGVDRSSGMLSRARHKALSANLVQADGTALPLRDGSVDFVFGVLVLHHFDDLAPLFNECARVLRGGYAAFVTSPHPFIEAHPLNRYFPSFAGIDTARFQSEEVVRETFDECGFDEIDSKHKIERPVVIDASYVDKVGDKFISTLRLVPEREFDNGMRQLREDIAATGRLEKPIEWESVTIWGRVRQENLYL